MSKISFPTLEDITLFKNVCPIEIECEKLRILSLNRCNIIFSDSFLYNLQFLSFTLSTVNFIPRINSLISLFLERSTIESHRIPILPNLTKLHISGDSSLVCIPRQPKLNRRETTIGNCSSLVVFDNDVFTYRCYWLNSVYSEYHLSIAHRVARKRLEFLKQKKIKNILNCELIIPDVVNHVISLYV